ncbi:trafficking kinesin-binding protein 2-like isoform X1 [Acipenser ruthenus]|uniref:trafficking kinesin-binding protein 2-like isoform X1 n=1 Tax=Acipenser ruthenus TaxID=7906 RepID=UPI00145ADDE7|nr:trafficking kinesin-binding protein 2-like isoform X1 [Acipenser ruthenus]XP_033901097.1 trafficking kinesin-binding protein 2-like isoform X1 [Acipenser ruthenus]XP_058889507.1 trafficking kinesin-binding protein 2-like isoform X1 [Acipenser ruthenus]
MFEVKSMTVEHKETGPITDVGCSEDLPEAELVGLLEDQLPQYRLQADSLYLYDSQDWVQSPTYSTDDVSSALSPVLAEETFRYMTFLALEPRSLSQVLSSDRVEQMTKTYNDIDMVTHLLAERDRDLELAARIGQSLLQRNHVLAERNEALEEQLAQSFDQVNQLQHELSKKDELLRIVASASEESETDSSCSTPLRHNESFTMAQGLSQLEALQSKLRDMEEENLALRSKACHLKTETITYEEKEQQLVSDCVKELRESNSQMVRLTEELSQKNEDLVRHQEEIANLLSQIVDLQHRVKELAIEKEELKIHLQASKVAQRQLTTELHDLQDLNAECLGMLHESQEENKELRSKTTATTSMRRHQSHGIFPMDSLAAEIEGTMRRELSVEEETSFHDQRNKQKRVFDAVKTINESVRSHSPMIHRPLPIPGSNQTNVIMTAQPFLSGDKSSTEQPTHSPRDGHRLGQPGTPGSSDLGAALHRLSLRRQNYLCERQFLEEERERKLQALVEEDGEGSGCSTPCGSIFSTGTNRSDISGTSSSFRSFLPDKLQIVKPLEGSLTLHHWQQLAQPHLATILDCRPGVVTKGFKPLPEDTVYHLSDLEEDEEQRAKREEEEEEGITFQVQYTSTPEDKKRAPQEEGSPPNIFLPKSQILTVTAPSSAHNPGKCLSSTHSTYTFTNCRILHPSDITQVTHSSMYAPLPLGDSTPSSMRTGPSTPVTPCRMSLGEAFTHRRNSTTTLSTTSGLAKLLQERGISAQVYSSLVSETPSSIRSPRKAASLPAPPSTPPNSPSHSPCGSPVPFEPRQENFLASRPAEVFLQDVYGLKPSRSRPDLTQNRVNLVERLKRMGFTKVLQAGPKGGLQHHESALFVATGGSLLDGLRRNQSLPVMIGGLGPPVSSPPAVPLTLPRMDSVREDRAPEIKSPAGETTE